MAEEETDKFKEEFKQLQWSNAEKVTQFKEIEEIKTENLNLKQKVKDTGVNLALMVAELIKLSEKEELLETKSQEDSTFEEKAIEIFKYACFKGK